MSKNTKTININDLEGFGIVDNLDSHLTTSSGATKEEVEKLERKIKTLDGLCTTYYSQMNKLGKYIEESQDYVNKCVRESLQNQAILQAHIEYELYLCQVEVDITKAQAIALLELPWYKRTKKNKDKVLQEVHDYFHEKSQEHIKHLQNNITNAIKRHRNE